MGVNKVMLQPEVSPPKFRIASATDIPALLELEHACFSTDRLSKRSFKKWIVAKHAALLLAEWDGKLVGYGLLWCHKGTRLARLYSLAVSPIARGLGIADSLIHQLEVIAIERNRIFMRLEVSKNNTAAIACYKRNGFRVFGEFSDYYEDHSDALRMQKRILFLSLDKLQRKIPWYRQTTEFTCGPASLMMAMASFDDEFIFDQNIELDIWREATTIYMTSGHGGCHPIGLGLAAKRRGYQVEVFCNSNKTLFIDSVRAQKKRDILEVVHRQFVATAKKENMKVEYREILQGDIEAWLEKNCVILMLISTFRLDGKKAPHWVCITGVDERCFYVHDPDLADNEQVAIDCQYLPIAKEDFDLMAAFGSDRLRAAVVLHSRT